MGSAKRRTESLEQAVHFEDQYLALRFSVMSRVIEETCTPLLRRLKEGEEVIRLIWRSKICCLDTQSAI